MATSKNTTGTSNSATKTAGKPAAKPAAPRGIPAPSIKRADVVVPTMSVVGAMPALVSAKDDADLSESAPMLKKQEFVERVVKATGAKKKDVKLILEAALGVLGDALSAGEELNLPPLGKTKLNCQRNEGGAEILIIKLRRGGGAKAAMVARKRLLQITMKMIKPRANG